MKFVFAKLDLRGIERRVREEMCRTGKRVIEVVLTSHEWCEFISTLNCYEPGRSAYRLSLHGPISCASCLPNDCAYLAEATVDVITVRPQ